MDSWELIAMFRHARTLLGFTPNAQLSRALVNFMSAAHRELERRGECNDEYLLGALAPLAGARPAAARPAAAPLVTACRLRNRPQ